MENLKEGTLQLRFTIREKLELRKELSISQEVFFFFNPEGNRTPVARCLRCGSRSAIVLIVLESL